MCLQAIYDILGHIGHICLLHIPFCKHIFQHPYCMMCLSGFQSNHTHKVGRQGNQRNHPYICHISYHQIFLLYSHNHHFGDCICCSYYLDHYIHRVGMKESWSAQLHTCHMCFQLHLRSIHNDQCPCCICCLLYLLQHMYNLAIQYISEIQVFKKLQTQLSILLISGKL